MVCSLLSSHYEVLSVDDEQKRVVVSAFIGKLYLDKIKIK